MKTFSQFVQEAWNPPFKPLPGSSKTPMQKAREKSKTNPNVNLDAVRTSPKRFAEPFNTSSTDDYDVSQDKDKKGNPVYTFKSKRGPVQVSFTQIGDKHHIQNTTVTDPNRANLPQDQKNKLARIMTSLKKSAISSARPGETISSQPISDRRATLNTRTQGLSARDERGNQHGITRNLSPRQKAKRTPPTRPTTYNNSIIDPNYS